MLDIFLKIRCYQKSYSRSRSYLRVPGCKTTKFRNVRGANKADDFCINPKKTELRLKYYSIFPNCSNIRCYSNIRLKDMKKRCNRNGKCHGFSWTRGRNRDWQRGGGCLKRYCTGKPWRRGYGGRSHGYYERKTKITSKNNGAWVGPHNYMDGNGRSRWISRWWGRFLWKKPICEMDFDGR